jgi:hypothetical protein
MMCLFGTRRRQQVVETETKTRALSPQELQVKALADKALKAPQQNGEGSAKLDESESQTRCKLNFSRLWLNFMCPDCG